MAGGGIDSPDEPAAVSEIAAAVTRRRYLTIVLAADRRATGAFLGRGPADGRPTFNGYLRFILIKKRQAS
jgi:hypothetical protein